MGVIRKTSTSNHLIGRKKKKVIPTVQDIYLFRQLKELLKRYEERLDLKIDTDAHYELWTKDGYRTTSMHPVTRTGIQFAAIMIFPTHVTFYFQPLYLDVTMRAELTERLKRYFRGQSCFHFDELTDELKADLEELLRKGWISFRKLGIIKRDL
jgi:hypothetical protein